MANLSQQDKKTLDEFQGMTVGEIFRKSRESQGYNLPDIALHLNIGSDHLTAIENDDHATLPQKVYAVGFVRAYADVLGLDNEKMAYLFKIQAYGKKQVDEHKEFIRAEGKEINTRELVGKNAQLIPIFVGGLIVLGGIITMIVMIVMWLLSPSDPEDQLRVPEVPQTLMEQQDQDEAMLVPAANTSTNADEPMDLIIRPGDGGQSYGVDPLQAALVLKLNDSADVDIRLVNSGEQMMSQSLNTGDVIYLSENQDILISTSKGSAIEVYLDGQKIGVLGVDPSPVQMRPLSVQALRLQRDG